MMRIGILVCLLLVAGCGSIGNTDGRSTGGQEGKGDYAKEACQDVSICHEIDDFVLDCVSDDTSEVDCLHFYEDGAIDINVLNTAHSCCAIEAIELSFCIPLGPPAIDSMCDNIDTVIDECTFSENSLDDCIDFFQEGADNSNAHQDLMDCCDVSNATYPWCVAMAIAPLIANTCLL